MYKKTLIILILLSLVMTPVGALAQNNFQGAGTKLDTVAGSEGAGLSDQSIESVITRVVRIIFTWVGVLFFILMIYGGYRWMMARGNEEDVKQARAIIRAATIGLIVVLAAYAITAFVVNNLAGS